VRTPREVAEDHYGNWAADPVRAMEKCAPDVAYTLNVSPDALQIGGETVGREAVKAMMLAIREVFDYLVYIPRIMAVDGVAVRVNIEIIFRHKASGELLTGQIRSILTARDGLVGRVDEYVDAPMIEAFMRLFSMGSKAAE
jgi:ketosteroid isomerase-like protein